MPMKAQLRGSSMPGICRNKRLHPKEYHAWLNMKKRCDNSNCPAYHNYGGRGITYTKEWNLFEDFFRDMGTCPSPKLTLERVDNDGNYFKGNCVWATRTSQAWNRRTFQSNTSGVRGVSYHSTRQVWIAQQGRSQLYYGPSREAAITARLNWESSNQQILGV
jgi:hypothetical protein